MASPTKEEKRAIANAQRENERNIDKAIEETKDNTRRMVQEAKREIPEITSAFHDYQEQNINAIRDVANNALEIQRSVAKSNQSVFGSYANTGMFASLFMPYYQMILPRADTDMYARMAANFADTATSATRLSNELMLAAMEFTRNSLEYAKNSTRGLARIYRESAETAEQMSQDAARATRRSEIA